MIFDTHAHYADSAFDADRDALLSSMKERNVGGILLQSTSPKDIIENLAIAQAYPEISLGIGIHPEEINSVKDAQEVEQILKTHLSQKEKLKIRCIGEIGLDYHYEGYDAEKQKQIFAYQLDLALAEQLPVSVHCRDASGDCMDLLRPRLKQGLRGVMHCFSGSVEIAKELTDKGFYLGFGGVITFKNARRSLEVLEAVPRENILIETDCPYMAPVPFRGKRNDSSLLCEVVAKLSELYHISPAEVESLTEQNAKKLFSM